MGSNMGSNCFSIGIRTRTSINLRKCIDTDFPGVCVCGGGGGGVGGGLKAPVLPTPSLDSPMNGIIATSINPDQIPH